MSLVSITTSDDDINIIITCDCLRRICRKSKFKKIRNEDIRRVVNLKYTKIEKMKMKLLRKCGRRKKILEWVPSERRTSTTERRLERLNQGAI